MEGEPVLIPSPHDEEELDEGAAQRRERSQIEFPYGDLEDAEGIATAIHSNYGLQCSLDQLAASLHQTTTSGAFRTKLGTARIFGLVETERGGVTLTDTGRKIADASQRAAARAEAFLKVPLYSRVFTKFQGHLLPPAAALEREMAGFGVAQKQTPRARQAFERSAQQAGFFAHGSDRLVAPPMGGLPETRPIAAPESPRPGSGDGGGHSTLHPFVQGLLKTLPEPETEWVTPERIKWLRTAANIFDLIYTGAEGEVDVSTKRTGRSEYDDRR